MRLILPTLTLAGFLFGCADLKTYWREASPGERVIATAMAVGALCVVGFIVDARGHDKKRTGPDLGVPCVGDCSPPPQPTCTPGIPMPGCLE